MAILKRTEIAGTVAWLGLVRDRAQSLCSEAVERVEARFEGLVGECHSGLTRPSCSRVSALHPRRGTPIRNSRQISLLSTEEMAEIATALELPALRPEWVGANILLTGLPHLTLLPPASRLRFEGGACLTVDMENAPCKYPAEEIERHHPGTGRHFIGAARGKRGVTVWVEAEGGISLGERVELFVPPQRLYPALQPTAS